MPAGRPIKKRTSKTYQRDIESLGRLRTALQLDPSLSADLVAAATMRLDHLVIALRPLLERSNRVEKRKVDKQRPSLRPQA